MKNFRRLSSAMIFSIVIGTAMVTFSPTLHAAVPGSDQSVSVRCELLKSALDAATTIFGADSALAIYLAGQVAAVCGQ